MSFEVDDEGDGRALALLQALERLPGLRRVALTHREAEGGGRG